MSTPDAAAYLARLSDTYPYRHTAERLRTLRLSDGRTVEYPGPRTVAHAARLLPDLAALRRRGAGLTRPAPGTLDPLGVGLDDVARSVRDLVAALPDRDDAGRPYRDLRTFAAHADSREVDAYFGEVARQVRTLTPRESTAASPEERAERAATRRLARQAADADKAADKAARAAERAALAARTPQERARDRRDADRTRYAASVATATAHAAVTIPKWAASLPAGRHPLTDAWQDWSDFVDRMSPGPLRDVLRGVGRTRFYELLAEAADVRPGHARRRVLVVPARPVVPVVPQSAPEETATVSTTAAAEADPAAALADEVARLFIAQRLAWATSKKGTALRLQRERLDALRRLEALTTTSAQEAHPTQAAPAALGSPHQE